MNGQKVYQLMRVDTSLDEKGNVVMSHERPVLKPNKEGKQVPVTAKIYQHEAEVMNGRRLEKVYTTGLYYKEVEEKKPGRPKKTED